MGAAKHSYSRFSKSRSTLALRACTLGVSGANVAGGIRLPRHKSGARPSCHRVRSAIKSGAATKTLVRVAQLSRGHKRRIRTDHVQTRACGCCSSSQGAGHQTNIDFATDKNIGAPTLRSTRSTRTTATMNKMTTATCAPRNDTIGQTDKSLRPGEQRSDGLLCGWGGAASSLQLHGGTQSSPSCLGRRCIRRVPLRRRRWRRRQLSGAPHACGMPQKAAGRQGRLSGRRGRQGDAAGAAGAARPTRPARA